MMKPFVFLLLAAVAWALEMCMSSPKMELIAGRSEVALSYESLFGQFCRASVLFHDASYPPITFSFGAASCPGLAVASFIVPPDVPNGDAIINWQCDEESPTCMLVSITNGQGGAPALYNEGEVECTSMGFWQLAGDSPVVSPGPGGGAPAETTPDYAGTLTNGEGSVASGQPTQTGTLTDSEGPVASDQPTQTGTLTNGEGSVASDQPTQAGTLTNGEGSVASDQPTRTDAGTIESDAQEAPEAEEGSVRAEPVSEPSETGSNLLQVSSATRVVVPSVALTILTVTQTITTLISSTVFVTVA